MDLVNEAPQMSVPERTTARLTRDELRQLVLASEDIKIIPVPTPEWPKVDGHIFVRTLSGTQRERYIESIRQTIGTGKKATIKVLIAESGAKLAVQTMCTEQGELLFDRTPEDVAALGAKSAIALVRVVDASAKLNGLSDDAEEESKNDFASATT